MWSVSTGQEAPGFQRAFRDESGAIAAAAFSADSRWIATGGRDGTVTVRDMATGKVMETWKGPYSQITALALYPDGKRVVTGHRYGAVRVWEIATGQVDAGWGRRVDFSVYP